MSQNASYFKLGLFVIIAFVLGAAFLVIFGAGKLFKKQLLAETCFNESVQGLSVGSEVKYKGIQIGTVASITSAAQVYNTESDFVLVTISLENDISMGQTGTDARQRIQKAVRNGLTVRLSFKGLTGAAYLETDYTRTPPEDQLEIPWTPSTIYIPSEKSNIKQFGDAFNHALETLSAIDIKEIASNIETLLKTLNHKVNDFEMARISNLLASLLSELNAVSRKITRAADDQRIEDILNDARASFKGVRQIVETTGPRVESLSANLDGLVQSLSAVSAQLDSMVWMNSDRIGLIIENLEATSENLKQMSREIKQYPGRLLFQKPPEKDPAGDRKN